MESHNEYYILAISGNSGLVYIILLTLKAPITTAADNVLIFFLIFQRKKVLTFHVNRLPMNRQDLFSLKNKKKL